MFESFNRFSLVNTNELKGKTLEEVVRIFQETSSKKVRNKCFAYVFCDLFPMFLKLFNKYTAPDPIEKVEECIYYVARSMSRYNLKDQDKIKFTSYVYGNISRAYITLTHNYSKNNKRKVWNNLVAWDEETLRWYLSSIKDEDQSYANFDLIFSVDNNELLDQAEKDLCKSLILGYNKSEDLISRLKITHKQVKNQETKQLMTVPLTLNQAKSRLSKLKKSLRIKVKNNSYSLFN